MLDLIQRNFFPETDRVWKKDWPPVVALTYSMMITKKEQTEKALLKRKHEIEGKNKLDDTMLGFQNVILPTAEGCHPNITIGAQRYSRSKIII
jgi:hypothetical protein